MGQVTVTPVQLKLMSMTCATNLRSAADVESATGQLMLRLSDKRLMERLSAPQSEEADTPLVQLSLTSDQAVSGQVQREGSPQQMDFTPLACPSNIDQSSGRVCLQIQLP